jgi:hypothetical protein
MSDAYIKPFKGMVDCGALSNTAQLRDITRICEQVAREGKKGDEP